MLRVPPRSAGLLAAVVLLPLLTAAACDDRPSGIAVGAATRGTVDEIVEAPASITARAAATVSAPADGILTGLRVAAGDQVRRGQIVAVITSPDTAQRLRQARQALAATAGSGSIGLSSGTVGFDAARRQTDRRAATAFATARSTADGITDPAVKAALVAQVDVARQQYAAASASAGAALQSVRRGVAGLSRAVGSLGAAQRIQARQAYDLAKSAADALTLRAPVTGVIQLGGTAAGSGGTPSLSELFGGASGATGVRAATTGTLPGVDTAIPQGAVVSAGTPILTVVDTARLGLSAQVDETDVLLVKTGEPATAELDAATGATYDAVVRSIDVLPTTSARGGVSYRVRLDVTGGTGSDGQAAPTPRPGMSAVVRLRVGLAADAITVPAAAVVNVDGHDTVWAVRAGKATRVPVTLGVQGEDAVQVTAGLAAGDRVVVAGADRVKSGQALS